MVDPGQAAIGIVVLLIVVGALLYIFYSRTNAVEKTGYGALMFLAVISLMIPVFWILESNKEAVATTDQFTTAVQNGATLYAQYCFQCHGTKGQGIPGKGAALNNNSTVNSLSDAQIMAIISGGVINPTNPSTPLMQPFSQQFNGPLDDNDIQYLFSLIRSSDPAYLKKNGYPTGTNANGFTQVPNDIQLSNPSTYETAVAAEAAGQFGTPVDMTNSKNITINILAPTNGQSCNPDCYTPINIKVKVGTKITWVNKSPDPHTVTAIQGTNPSVHNVAANAFDSGNTPIPTNGQFTWIVSMAGYSLNPDHSVIYFCRIHPQMVAMLTIVP
jgi:plastocyanin/mono/diheme cytochrome c family protein